jgi:hypothetical protein
MSGMDYLYIAEDTLLEHFGANVVLHLVVMRF